MIRLAFALGHELAPHGGTAVALTPGWLRSEMMLEAFGVTEANWRDAAGRSARTSPHLGDARASSGRAVAALAADPDVPAGTRPSLSAGQLARHYGFTDLDGTQPDAWRYLVEVQDAGHPADATGYR